MQEITVKKNEEEELPIPHIWRTIFKEIVKAFVERDYEVIRGIKNVNPVSKSSADQIKGYIEDYGEELIELPEDTWDTSVYICHGDYWNVLIDLFTKEEGLSDLTLNAEVRELNGQYAVDVQLVYVP